MRQGAPWPPERPSNWLVVRELPRAWEGDPTAEPAWAVERRRRRPQEHGWASQRAVARRGGPGGPDAGRGFVSLSTSSASVQCPVSGASSVHAWLSIRPVSGVRCGRLSVQVSAVRRPLLVSGVCALPRALCPAEVRSWSAAVGQAAVRLGWPGSAWSPAALQRLAHPGDRHGRCPAAHRPARPRRCRPEARASVILQPLLRLLLQGQSNGVMPILRSRSSGA
jgi:hypothetical protein